MSSASMSILPQISRHLTIYVGTVEFIGGVLGGLLSIIVFLSLRTFRESSCAFYLTVMSFVNIGNLSTGLLSRILISGFAIDWTLISPFYCKFRWYCLQLGVLTSFTCVCLAVLDQYFSTHARPQCRKWSNTKLAHRLMAFFLALWLSHGIFYAVFFNLLVSPTTGKVSCGSENLVFRQYHVYGYLIILAGGLPLIISAAFGLLALHNVQQLAYRAVPLVRRELDKQLTQMVLVQIVHNCISTLPYTILTTVSSVVTYNTDPNIAARFDFANVLSILLYYSSFSVRRIVFRRDPFDCFSLSLESFLYLYLCFVTIPPTIGLCSIRSSFQTVPTSTRHSQPSHTQCLTDTNWI